MTDAFDVSLRVKLDYQAGAAARTAVADLGAIESTAKRLGAASSVLAVARDLGELRKGADVARAGLTELAAAGARLNRAGGSSALSSELGRVEVGAGKAGRAVDQLGDKLGAAIKAQRAAGGFKSGADLEAFLKTFDAQVKGLGAVADGAREARREVTEVGEAAAASARDLDRMASAAGRAGGRRGGAADDPVRRAGQTWRRRERSEAAEQAGAEAQQDAFYAEQRRRIRLMDRSAAIDARRQRQEERQEKAADREAEAQARRQGRAGHDEGAPSGGARHSGPGGVRGALIAGARPLHMERLLMSAMTPTGLAGLGAGLGLAGIAHQIQDATGRAIELEDALNDIRRSTGTMSAEGVKGLETDILRTSRATGETTGALARMGAEAAAAGRPAEDLPRFMDFGAKAAGAFGVKVDDVGARLTRIGADFGLDQRALEAAADTAALLQERTGARGAGTLDFMAATGGQAKLAGMAPGQLAAYGATMGHLGMAPGDAASTFGGLLEKLESAPMQGGGFKTGLTRIAGPDGAPESPYALRNAMRADPSAGMLRFLEDVKRLPDNKRQTVLTEMFGSEEGDKIARMADHLDDFKRNLSTVQDTAARSGAVERVFKVFDEATSKKVDRATEAIGAFATKMGQHFAPAVGAAADATSRFFGGWLDRMDRLEQAGEIAEKIAKGVALAPDQQKKLDADPALKAQVQGQVDAIGVARANDRAASPDPEAGRRREMDRMGAAPAAVAGDADAARERDRLGRVEAIHQLKDWGRSHGEASVADDLRDQLAAYAHDFPDKPLPAFARGGRVSGPGGPREDKVHALLSAGEFVVNAASAARHHGLLRAINDNALPAYADGGTVGALLPATAPSGGDPAALDKLQGAIEAGVKAGVVAGLRDARDMPGSGSAATVIHASFEQGDGDGSGGGDGGGGGPRRSLRFGRAAGGGYRSTPTGRATGGPGPTAYGQAGSGTIGPGDGTATTQDSGPGFTAGMRARNLGNIGYFGQHTPGLIGPSNAHDVDHSIGLFATQEDGIRAAASLALKKYQGGRHSAWDLIAAKGGWTPGALGPGASKNIAAAMGIDNQSDMHLDQPGQMHKFLRGLAMQEHGSAGAFYSDAMIDRALAGGGPAASRDGVAKGSSGSGDAAGIALGLKDANAGQAAAALHHTMTAGLWCADFMNGVIGAAGGKGTGSAAAASFAGWGKAVSIGSAQRGDVILENAHGRGINHVGMATGNVQRDAAGNVTAVEMISGNYGHKVTKNWERAGIIAGMRRGSDAQVGSAQPLSPRFTDPGLKSAYDTKGAPAGGTGASSHGGGAAPYPSVVQNFYGQHDPRETARHATRERNREIRRSQARANHSVGRLA